MRAILRLAGRVPSATHSGRGANVRGDGGPASHGGGHGRGENRESCDNGPHLSQTGVGVIATFAPDHRRQSCGALAGSSAPTRCRGASTSLAAGPSAREPGARQSPAPGPSAWPTPRWTPRLPFPWDAQRSSFTGSRRAPSRRRAQQARCSAPARTAFVRSSASLTPTRRPSCSPRCPDRPPGPLSRQRRGWDALRRRRRAARNHSRRKRLRLLLPAPPRQCPGGRSRSGGAAERPAGGAGWAASSELASCAAFANGRTHAAARPAFVVRRVFDIASLAESSAHLRCARVTRWVSTPPCHTAARPHSPLNSTAATMRLCPCSPA